LKNNNSVDVQLKWLYLILFLKEDTRESHTTKIEKNIQNPTKKQNQHNEKNIIQKDHFS